MAEVQDMVSQLLIGQSAALEAVMQQIRQIAAHPLTSILIQGESGTGKDVVAQAIHLLTANTGAFIPINCAAIPDTLLETELFGVEAGAYTDAKASRDGYIVRADRGTLFLDEIGSMPLGLQAKLLRFLETRSFHRVGSTKESRVSLRVISATHVNLQQAVAQKHFRDDLFYRLKVFSIHIPPLRERQEDIPLLVDFFLQNSQIQRSSPLTMSPEALKALCTYSWPGNVRELRSVVEHCLIISEGTVITVADLPEVIHRPDLYALRRLDDIKQQLRLPGYGLDLAAFLSSIEDAFIQEALERCNGNQVRAASLLRMSRDQLRYRLQTIRAQRR